MLCGSPDQYHQERGGFRGYAGHLQTFEPDLKERSCPDRPEGDGQREECDPVEGCKDIEEAKRKVNALGEGTREKTDQ